MKVPLLWPMSINFFPCMYAKKACCCCVKFTPFFPFPFSSPRVLLPLLFLHTLLICMFSSSSSLHSLLFAFRRLPDRVPCVVVRTYESNDGTSVCFLVVLSSVMLRALSPRSRQPQKKCGVYLFIYLFIHSIRFIFFLLCVCFFCFACLVVRFFFFSPLAKALPIDADSFITKFALHVLDYSVNAADSLPAYALLVRAAVNPYVFLFFPFLLRIYI